MTAQSRFTPLLTRCKNHIFQLVSLPSILVADEPTTGLDSSTAHALLTTLSRLAVDPRRPITIVVTLHQPRSASFSLFSNLLVLSRGSVVYSGPRSNCFPWFSSLGEGVELTMPSSGINPFDWLIDIATVDTRKGNEAESQTRVEALIDAWRTRGPNFVMTEDDTEKGGKEEEKAQSPLPKAVSSPSRTLSSNALAHVIPTLRSDVANTRPSRLSWARQTRVLLGRYVVGVVSICLPFALKARMCHDGRALIDVRRNYGFMIVLTVKSILMGIVVGVVYWKLPEVSCARDRMLLKSAGLPHRASLSGSY